MDAPKPYEFIWFVAMDAPKPYEFIGSGAMDAPKPYAQPNQGGQEHPAWAHASCWRGWLEPRWLQSYLGRVSPGPGDSIENPPAGSRIHPHTRPSPWDSLSILLDSASGPRAWLPGPVWGRLWPDANGQQAGPKLPGPDARDVWDRLSASFALRLRPQIGPGNPASGPETRLSNLRYRQLGPALKRQALTKFFGIFKVGLGWRRKS